MMSLVQEKFKKKKKITTHRDAEELVFTQTQE